jgi:predicted SAM-dependent methyltransferase
MLGSLLRGLFRKPEPATPAAADNRLRLHIGGTTPHPDWKILNAQAGPDVDFVGDCADLSFLATGSVGEVYASHVLEHLGYAHDLPTALGEILRVLVPGGTLKISVPDIEVLSAWMVDPALSREEHFHVMRMMFGGQMDAYDFHKTGLTWELLEYFLNAIGYTGIERVESFGLFADGSETRFRGRRVSLSVIARKPVT